MTVTFDTLAVSRRLRDAEFSDIQAEALTSAIGTALAGGVATKADILSLETKMEAEIVRLEGKIDADIARLESKIDTGLAEVRAEVARLEGKIDTGLAQMRGDMIELRESLRWIMRIGGAILVLVAYPVIRDLLTGAI